MHKVTSNVAWLMIFLIFSTSTIALIIFPLEMMMEVTLMETYWVKKIFTLDTFFWWSLSLYLNSWYDLVNNPNYEFPWTKLICLTLWNERVAVTQGKSGLFTHYFQEMNDSGYFKISRTCQNGFWVLCWGIMILI